MSTHRLLSQIKPDQRHQQDNKWISISLIVTDEGGREGGREGEWRRGRGGERGRGGGWGGWGGGGSEGWEEVEGVRLRVFVSFGLGGRG